MIFWLGKAHNWGSSATRSCPGDNVAVALKKEIVKISELLRITLIHDHDDMDHSGLTWLQASKYINYGDRVRNCDFWLLVQQTNELKILLVHKNIY